MNAMTPLSGHLLPKLFDPEWADCFCLLWNDAIARKHIGAAMAGAGALVLRVQDASADLAVAASPDTLASGPAVDRGLCLHWDEAGRVAPVVVSGDPASRSDRATVLEVDRATLPAFSASAEAWLDMIEGRRGAVASVLAGAIAYRGPFRFAARYGAAFDQVASIARAIAVEEMTMKSAMAMSPSGIATAAAGAAAVTVHPCA